MGKDIEIDSLKKEIEKNKRSAAEAQTLLKEKNDLENKVSMLNIKHDDMQRKMMSSEQAAEVDKLQKQLAQEKQNFEKLNKDFSRLVAELGQIKAEKSQKSGSADAAPEKPVPSPETENLKQRLADAAKKTAALESDISKRDNDTAALIKEFDTLKDKYDKKSRSEEDLRAELKQLRSKSSPDTASKQIESENEMLRKDNEALNEKYQRTLKENSESAKILAGLKNELNKKEARDIESSKLAQSLKTELDALKAAPPKTEPPQEDRKKLQELEVKNTALSADMKKLSEENQRLSGELKKTTDTLSETLKTRPEDAEKKEKSSLEMTRLADDLRKQNRELSLKITNLEATIKEKDRRIDESRSMLDSVSKENSSLKLKSGKPSAPDAKPKSAAPDKSQAAQTPEAVQPTLNMTQDEKLGGSASPAPSPSAALTETDKDKFKYLMDNAAKAEKSGDSDGALWHYNKAAKLNPKDPAPLIRAAALYSARNDNSQALASLEAAEKLKADDPELLMRLGAALAKAGKNEDAERRLKKSLELRPNSAEACLETARLFLAAGKKEEAETYYSKAKSLGAPPDSQFEKPPRAERPTVQERDDKNALRGVYSLSPGEKNDVDSAGAEYLSASLKKALASGDYESAAWLGRKLLRISPGDGTAWKDYGLACYGLKRDGTAFEAFEKAKDLKVDSNDMLLPYAVLCNKNNKTQQALELLNMAALIYPKDPRVVYEMGLVCLKLGHNDLAENKFRKTLELDPKNGDAAAHLSRILVKDSKRTEEARKWYKVAKENGGQKDALLDATFK
jgi:Flp pilus assembly protein TadD